MFCRNLDHAAARLVIKCLEDATFATRRLESAGALKTLMKTLGVLMTLGKRSSCILEKNKLCGENVL